MPLASMVIDQNLAEKLGVLDQQTNGLICLLGIDYCLLQNFRGPAPAVDGNQGGCGWQTSSRRGRARQHIENPVVFGGNREAERE